MFQIKGSASSRFVKQGENNDIFTPFWLAKRMFILALNNISAEQEKNELSVLEPCCGKGDMIFGMLDVVTFARCDVKLKITAVELKKEYLDVAIGRTKRYPMIDDITIDYKCANFLTTDFDKRFDIILMNPPFSEKSKNSGTTAFVDRSMELLKDDGVLITVAPDYFLVNSEARKKKYAHNISERYWLPLMTFDTTGDGCPNKLHALIIVIKKRCENKTYLFADRKDDDKQLYIF